MDVKRLSIAVIIEAPDIYAWQYSALETLLADEDNSIGLIIYNEKAKTVYNASGISCNFVNGLQKFNRILVRLMSRLPGLRSNIGVYNDAFAHKDIQSLVSNAKMLQLEFSNSSTKKSKFSNETVLGIKSAGVDLIIDFCGLDSYGEILNYIRYGVYVYKYGLFNNNTSLACGAYESLLHIYETWFKLKVYTKRHNKGVDVYRESISTHRLAACNTNNLMWASAGAIRGQLDLLKQFGMAKYMESDAITNHLSDVDLLYKDTCDNVLILSLINACSYAKYVLQFIKNVLFYYQWFLVLIKNYNADQPDFSQKIIQLTPGTDRFWADPFITVNKDYIYIFAEEEMRSSRRGHISVIKLDLEGKVIDVRPIIAMNYHMSYPFIFSYNNGMYMIPETSQDSSINLYKCTAFPERWQFVKTLLTDIKAVDTSVIYYNGLWWMFLGKYSEDGAHNRLLYLYYAEVLFSDEWISHPLNPIVRDVRGARNAGRIFKSKGSLYRPSQDCSRGYGYGIRMKKIIALSKTEYREEEVTSLNADNIRGVSGIHTINADKDLTVVDMQKCVFRFSRKNKTINTKMFEQKMNEFSILENTSKA